MTYLGIVIIITIILCFCSIYKRKYLKIFLALVIGIMFVLLVMSLYWTIVDFENSWFYSFSKVPDLKLLPLDINTWAIRGQIGDILAGHFSALAFFAIALSIYFQSEGNKQIKDSLTIQSKALEAQIKELQDSRKESEKQTEEFFISNMNVKLDRYYRILDKSLEIVTEEYLYGYLDKISTIGKVSKISHHEYKDIQEFKRITNDQATKIRPVVMTLNFIYDEIIKIKKTSPLAYQTYIEELRLRLHSNEIFRTINTKIDEYNEIPVFDLYKEQK